MEDSRVTSKGQVTIPKAIRDRYDITPGTRVVFDDAGGEVVMRRSKESGQHEAVDDKELAAYLDRVRGTLDLGMSTDEYMELLRGE